MNMINVSKIEKFKIPIKKILKNKNINVVLLTAVLIIIFAATDRNFISLTNISTLMRNMPDLGIVALGMTMLIICGEFDLSVGSIFGLAPYFMVYTITKLGFPQGIGLLIAIFAGAIFGLINGFIVTKMRVPSLIATLGMLRVYRGILILLTNGKPIEFPKNLLIVKILTQDFNGFPMQFLWFIFFAVIMFFLLENHKFGNWTSVTGGNRLAAISLGIPVNLVKDLNFMIVGMLSAFAGSIQASRLHSSTPIAGNGVELSVIAAVVIGGTLLLGGSGTIVGAVMGIIIIFSVENILILAGAPSFWFQLFVGLIIIIVVAFHVLIRGRKEL